MQHAELVTITPESLLTDPWAEGPWCFVVSRVVLLKTPFPARGMNGTWPVSAADRARILDETGVSVEQAWTFQQPYASAVAAGVKKIDNRPQRRILPEGGRWYGLHAGKEPYGGPERARDLMSAWSDPARLGAAMWPTPPELESLPRGVMLGVMHLSACLRYPEGTP